MVKETVVTNKSAAGLRRSAIAERIRLREEWSSLKGTDDETEPPAKTKKKQTKVFSKNLHNIREIPKQTSKNMTDLNAWRQNKENVGSKSVQRKSSCEALRGVVALVDVGAESRALALRAALAALGATVVSDWSPLVTHLVWSQAGSRSTRAKARALACSVVSPLWVEASAAAARRVPERVFPSTARDSDLPSPPTLCRLLKKAEKENWPLLGLQSDDEDGAGGRPVRLRISSDTDDNTKNTTHDGDTTQESVDVESRVNTAPRRALPVSISPPPANPKSRRKLFTVRADVEEKTDAEDTPARAKKTRNEKAPNRPEKAPIRPEKAPTRPEKAPTRPEKATNCADRVPERQKKKQYNLGQEQKQNLEKAKRLAKRLAAEPAVNKRIEKTQAQDRRISNVPRIVLTGMPKSQRQAVIAAIQALNGKLQNHVNRKTTHVLLGTCKEDDNNNAECQDGETSNERPKNASNQSTTNKNPISICNECNAPETVIRQVLENENVTVTNHCSQVGVHDNDVTIVCSSVNRDRDNVNSDNNAVTSDKRGDRHDISDLCEGITNDRSKRTLKTLLGAARGCRVLHAQWALDSQRAKRWLPYAGYEVTYLLKVAQKARVERFALDKMHAQYAYDVFRGTRVVVAETAEQREAAIELLTLCGAEIIDDDDAQNGGITQNGGQTQNGGATQNGRTQYGRDTQYNTIAWTQYCRATPYVEGRNEDIVIRVGSDENEVSSKWVFDSVAAGRPRTARRYVNRNNVHLEE
ncbi:uncharacterized protein [Epargyreus clarus]|uniref:uncharacterized protein n=1 Tax=Epargyreus clarus TaxID=520877 RepID=UPI003C2EA702